MEREKSKIENLREKHGREIAENVDWKKYLPIALVVILLVGGLYYAFSSDTVQRDRPDIEGDTVTVVVNDLRASPSRPEIDPDDGVKFLNNGTHRLRFTFDRNVESFVLGPGESRVVDINTIVYYDVTAVNDDSFRKIVAGVNVQ